MFASPTCNKDYDNDDHHDHYEWYHGETQVFLFYDSSMNY